MKRLFTAALLAAIAMASCGGVSYNPNVPTDSPPIVTRVDPNSGRAGDEITIFGLGFSIAYPENIVVVGNAPTGATSYSLLDNPTSDEIEAITFTVPADAEAGEGPVYVLVEGDSSNADVSFTVMP